MKWARLVIIILCFSTEIRVRADEFVKGILVDGKVGIVEIENNEEAGLDIQTFDKSTVRVSYQNLEISFKENTFMSLNPKNVWLHEGSIFVSVKKNQKIQINSRHGFILCDDDAQFIIQSLKNKTRVSVLFGAIDLGNRITKDKVIVRSGYEMWMGGILSIGKRAQGKQVALDYNEISQDLKYYGHIKNTQLNIELDHLRAAWTKAVDEVSVQTQDQVVGDMKIFEEWEAENQKRNIASQKEHRQLVERFRAHALDLPERSTKFPLE